MADYDAKEITKYYDTFGLKEWDRLVSNPVEEVSLYIHNHYLQEFIKPNDKILEIGAGPGRFTKELSKMTNKLTVTDISEVQLNEGCA